MTPYKALVLPNNASLDKKVVEVLPGSPLRVRLLATTSSMQVTKTELGACYAHDLPEKVLSGPFGTRDSFWTKTSDGSRGNPPTTEEESQEESEKKELEEERRDKSIVRKYALEEIFLHKFSNMTSVLMHLVELKGLKIYISKSMLKQFAPDGSAGLARIDMWMFISLYHIERAALAGLQILYASRGRGVDAIEQSVCFSPGEALVCFRFDGHFAQLRLQRNNDEHSLFLVNEL